MKRRAFTLHAVSPSAPAVTLDDIAANRQSDARAGVGSIEPLENAEDPLRIFLIETHTIVAYRYSPIVAVALGENVHRAWPLGTAILQAIANQVLHEPGKQQAVSSKLW